MHLENMCQLAVSAVKKNKQSFEQKLTGVKEKQALKYLGGKRKTSLSPKGRSIPGVCKISRAASVLGLTDPRATVREKVKKVQELRGEGLWLLLSVK